MGRLLTPLAGALLMAAPISVLALTFSPSATQAATPPNPTYGTATVDGDASEWDLTNDYYAPMYNAGDPSDPVLADGYLRYDCTSGTLYVMVRQAIYNGSLVPLLNSNYGVGNAWSYIDGNSNAKQYTDASGTNVSNTPPEFTWYGTGYDGNNQHSQGYEASFAISPGIYTIVVHVEALYSGSAATAGFVGFNSHATSQTVPLDIPASCTNPTSGGSTTSTTSTTSSSSTTTTGSTTTPTTTPTTTTTTTTPAMKDVSLSGPTPQDPATTSYARTYGWTISKTVNSNSVTQSSGSASFAYTVSAGETGYTDSSWRLAGDVTLSNPNNVVLTGVRVSDTVDNGGTCTVPNGTNLSIPASGSVSVNYTCTWSAAPTQVSGTDVATASWDPAVNHTPDSSTPVETPFAFGAPTATSDASITVTDTYEGTLGTLAATDASPYASQTYSYSVAFSTPASGCQSHDNTATIAETGQNASKAVSVCTAAGSGSAAPDPSGDPASVSGATNVPTGMPWAGFRPFELVALGLGTGLVALGLRRRRRTV